MTIQTSAKPFNELERRMDPDRIVAISDGMSRPLSRAPAMGKPSPSHSLLVESYRGRQGDVDTRTIPNQVLTLFLEPGLIEHACDNKPFSAIEVPTGTVVFSLRNQVETVHWLKPASVLSVQIEDSVLQEAACALQNADRFALQPIHGVRNTRLTAIMQVLHAEQLSGFASGPLFIEGIEQALAALLVCDFGSGSRPARVAAGGLPRVRAKRLEEFVRLNLGHPLHLRDLAESAGYSASHFSRLFQATFNTTPHQYVLRLRIEYAMTLLSTPGHSILDVAQQSGFQTSQHFSRIFKRLVGLSPGEFVRGRG
jgi:AraC family transcriptional regulator